MSPKPQDAPPEAAAPAKRSIKFTGASVITRVLTKDDFAKNGIEHDSITWDLENDHTVDATDLPDDVVALIARQPDFRVDTAQDA